jgi:spore germination protein GerM
MIRSRRVGVLAAAIGMLGLAGCGIPTDDGPRAISRENVPDEAVATTETTGPTPTVDTTIFLVQSPDENPRLVAVERPVPVESTSSSPEPAAVLELLLGAVADDEEQDEGIINLIPDTTRLESQPELQSGTLLIDLTRGIFDIAGVPQRAAFGQIVCTADELEGVDVVRFAVDGEPVQAPTDTGQSELVTCDRDYRRLLVEPE